MGLTLLCVEVDLLQYHLWKSSFFLHRLLLHIKINQLSVMAHICNPSTWEVTNPSGSLYFRIY